MKMKIITTCYVVFAIVTLAGVMHFMSIENPFGKDTVFTAIDGLSMIAATLFPPFVLALGGSLLSYLKGWSSNTWTCLTANGLYWGIYLTFFVIQPAPIQAAVAFGILISFVSILCTWELVIKHAIKRRKDTLLSLTIC